MGYFKEQIITEKGMKMFADAAAVGTDVTFTRIEVGDGVYTITDIAGMKQASGIKSKKASIPINSLITSSEGIRVGAVLSNEDLKSGYYIREIGLYASAGDEEALVALSICTDATASYLPAFSERVIEVPIADYIAYSGDGTFTIDYKSDVYASLHDIKKLQDGKADKTHKHNVATSSEDGFMSASDKTKMDSVEEGATKTIVDDVLSGSSNNPVANKTVTEALENTKKNMDEKVSGCVPTSRTINGKALSGNISLSAGDVGAIANNPYQNAGTSGTHGYVAIAQFKIGQNYANRPIEIELIRRGEETPCYVSVKFSNANNTDPNIGSLTYFGSDYGVFIHNIDTSTWLLYAEKSEAYDTIYVARIQSIGQGIALTYPTNFLTEKPTSNIVNATLGWKVGFATSATKASGVVDSDDSTRVIQIGYSSTGLTSNDITNVVAYTDSGKKLKNVSKDVLKQWLGLGDSAYKSVHSYTAASNCGWTSKAEGEKLITLNALAYWNGAHDTDNHSNLAYCKLGAFGTIVTKNAGDYATASHTHNYAGSSSAGGAANSLTYFKNTSTTNVNADDTTANAIGYVQNMSLFGQNDGALYKQVYSDKWVHEIFGDYRTGQMCVRGKNNGTWQNWRTILDSGNFVNYALSTAGGAMTGAISYKGTKATYPMITFIDNTSDSYGNGIAIGGGGATIIGGGESASSAKSLLSSGGDEKMIITNDTTIDFYTNCQNGIDSATHTYIAADGTYSGKAANSDKLSGYSASSTATGNTIALRNSSGYLFATYFNQSSAAETPTSSSYLIFANSDGYFRKATLASIQSLIGGSSSSSSPVLLANSIATDGNVFNPDEELYDGAVIIGGCTNRIDGTKTNSSGEVIVSQSAIIGGLGNMITSGGQVQNGSMQYGNIISSGIFCGVDNMIAPTAFSTADSCAIVAGQNCSIGGATAINTTGTLVSGLGCSSIFPNQFVIGHYNSSNHGHYGSTTGTYGTAMMIGNGTSKSGISNAFRFDYDGNAYGTQWNTSGADYAEFFEWQDENPDAEDRVGYFVTIVDDKIKIAKKNDYILGVVSGAPGVLGNADEDYMYRYETDEFGRFIMEDYEDIVENEYLLEKEDGTFEKIKKKETIKHQRRKERADYDPEQEYIPRKDRKEWDMVGLLGVLPVRDDGTCVVNGMCVPSDKGIGTASDTVGFRVIQRVSDNVVKVFIGAGRM